MNATHPLCLRCHSAAIPVQWGMPSSESIEAERRGLLRLGGCIVRGEPHTTWWCPVCEQSFIGHDTASALAAAWAMIDDS